MARNLGAVSLILALAALLPLRVTGVALAQTPPSAAEIAGYDGLHAVAHRGDVAAIRRLVADGADLEARDGAGRTPLHVAAFASEDAAVRALAAAGADLDALEHQAYDIVTIAAVANDSELLGLALKLGAGAGNVTSPYDGTALIAAAHLGHHLVVARLVEAGAPVDHVNNLGWTALIEAVILGDGGPDHIATVEALLAGGADTAIADRQGMTPLDHARARGYAEMVRLLEAAR
ncbi:MAG: ankyrin repeat domain-containing protein [Rhodospirillales bacterium]|nr:MAG: ankyrin repeat domain-containing protein [Rhodospirillales bacterium]